MNQPSEKIPLAALRLRITAIVVLICGLTLSVYFSATRATTEEHEFDVAINTECDGFATAVAREFESFASVLLSIRQLHTLSTHITDADFREFVTKGLVHQTAILHAFGFAQSIADAERRNIERTDTGPRALHIVEPDGSGGHRPAASRQQYFPLTYQFPDDGLGLPNGFDLGVAPGMADVIGRMAMAGGLAVTGPGYGPDRRDHLALAPIIYIINSPDGVPTGGFLSGFAVGLLRPAAIIDPSVKLAAARGLKLTLAARPPEEPDPASTSRERPVSVLGQIWSLRCEAGPDYIRRHRTGQPRLIFASGLAITGLLMLQLLVLARRAATIENAVSLRTAELERAIVERRRLEQEVLDISTQEKQRVGRDLHDSLGQKLTGATYLARALAGELADAKAPQHEAAAKINEVLKDATAQARRIARGLSPIDLSEGGLADALRRLAEETSEVFGISCTFHGDSAPAASSASATHLFMIAQEAVNNAVKHGGASEITILLESAESGGELVIEDNGRGLPPNATQTGGMGLRIMRYRAGLIGGELKIERGREGGTVVHCRFPV